MPNEYRIPSNQSLFDASVTLYGDVSYSIKLMLENDFITSTDYDASGQIVQYEAGFKADVLLPLTTDKPVTKNMSQVWKPYEGQSIFDIALQLDGTLESIINMVQNSTLPNINGGIYSTSRFNYTKKSNALLDWVEKTAYVFLTGETIGGTGREHDNSYERISHT